jgi:hypothetical protein
MNLNQIVTRAPIFDPAGSEIGALELSIHGRIPRTRVRGV